MPKIHHRERSRGTNPKFGQLLDDWEREGEHDIVIAFDGGLRTDEARQAANAAAGMSQAPTLKKTPHGRGAALDVYPVEFLEHVPESHGGTAKRWTPWALLPDFIKAKFRAFGEFAEKRGFKWGGRWVGRAFPNGDQPHVELADWQRLPYPAPIYAGAS